MAPSTAAGTSVARGYLPEIARAASHTPLMVSASPMRPRILAQPSAHGKRADMHLPATVVRSQTSTPGTRRLEYQKSNGRGHATGGSAEDGPPVEQRAIYAPRL